MNEVGFALVEVDRQPVHIPFSGALVILPEQGVHPDGWFPRQVLPDSVHIRFTLSGVRHPLSIHQGSDPVIVGGYAAALVEAGKGVDYVNHRSSTGMSDS